MAQADEDFAASIRGAVDHLLSGLRFGGMDALVASGLRESLSHERLGPVFLESSLEPTLAACEARLQTHVERGQMRPGDVRTAALALISPLVLAVLHQSKLGGCEVRELDWEAFAQAHADAFVRAWEAESQRL